jgi:hypothetical protein
MEHESLDYKIVMDDGSDTEVLGRLAGLDIADAAYLRAIVKYPLRNVQLRQGELIIKRHDGEPKPEPPKAPNLKKWSAHLIGGKKMQLLGFSRGGERACGDRDRCRIIWTRRAEAQASCGQSPTLAVSIAMGCHPVAACVGVVMAPCQSALSRRNAERSR